MERVPLQEDLLLTPIDPDDVNARSRRLSVVLILQSSGAARPAIPNPKRYVGSSLPAATGKAVLSPSHPSSKRKGSSGGSTTQMTCATSRSKPCSNSRSTRSPSTLPASRWQTDPTLRCPASWRLHSPRPRTGPAFWIPSQPASNAYAPDDAGSEWSLCDDIMKRAGRSDERVCAPETAWNAIRLLGIVHKRIRDEGADIASALSRFIPTRSVLCSPKRAFWPPYRQFYSRECSPACSKSA